LKGQYWQVPLSENRFFTGRVVILERLKNTLTIHRRAALFGLGGMGKTQTALHYIYQHRQVYQAILWLPGDDETNLRSSFLGLITVLGLPETNDLAVVQNWLLNHADWLLVIDLSTRPKF
jgi:hypothetical protein